MRIPKTAIGMEHRKFRYHRSSARKSTTCSFPKIFLLLFCVLSSARHAKSKLLSFPELQTRQTPAVALGSDFVGEGNGVAIHATNSYAYITTAQGKLLVAPIGNAASSSVRVLFQAPAVVGSTSTTCSGGVVLYKNFAIFAVTDRGNNNNVLSSRIFLVPIDFHSTTDPGVQTVQIISLVGAVKGTPLINKEGHLFVVHDVSTSTGRLSIFDLSQGTNALVTSVPSGNAANNVRVLSPPTMTRVTLDSGTIEDWVLVGENENNGLSTNGSLYGIRYDPSAQRAIWIVLAQNIGSMKKAPGVSRDGTTIAVGVASNYVYGWIDNVNIRNLLHGSNPQTVNNIASDSQIRVSNQNDPVPTQPVLMGNKVMVSGLQSDLIAFNMNTRNEVWRLSTYYPHTAAPINFVDPGTGKVILYDISTLGILRQAEVDNVRFNSITEIYQANCLGYIDPWTVTDAFTYTFNNCGALTLANYALSPDGNFLVYANADGQVTTLRVADYGTRAPTPYPSLSPSAAPTFAPSGLPSTSAPTTVRPTASHRPSMAPFPIRAPTPSPIRTPATPSPTQISGLRGGTPAPSSNDFGGRDEGGGDGGGGDNGGGDEDDDSDKTSGKESAAGLGAGGTDGDSVILGNLAIMLGAAAGVLFCAIFSVLFYLKRKASDSKQEEEEARRQREQERTRAWLSNKQQYEEEMRLEEEETLNDLRREGAPEATAAAEVLDSKKRRTRRFKGRKRTNGGATATLGSISESECEEDVFGSDLDDEEVESNLGNTDKDGESCSDGDTSSTGTPSPSGTPERRVTKAVPLDDPMSAKPMEPRSSPEQLKSPPAVALAAASVVAPGAASVPMELPSSQKQPQSPPPVALAAAASVIVPGAASTADKHRRWFAEVQAVRAASLRRMEDASVISQEKKLAPLAIPTSPLSTPNRNAQRPPDDEPGLIPTGTRHVVPGSSSSESSRKSQDLTPPGTPEPGAIPISPASPSDLLSVDSSLYLEGSTVATPAEGEASVLSGTSFRSAKGMAPPDGASVLSGAQSVKSKEDIEADQFFEKPFTPGSHYLSGQRRTPGVVVSSSLRTEVHPPIATPARTETPVSTVSLLSPRSLQRTYEEPGGPTMYGEAVPPQQSRAGLFSRRGRPVDRLLPQYESDATASASENEGEGNPRRPRRSKPPVVTPSSPPVPRPPLKLPQDSRSVADKAPHETASPANKSKPEKNSMWSSFLSELSKAEAQFFNPAVSGKQIRSNHRRDESSGAPLPPTNGNLSRPDLYRRSSSGSANGSSNGATDDDSDGSQEPPPPPPLPSPTPHRSQVL